jgi:hypothetical protein
VSSKKKDLGERALILDSGRRAWGLAQVPVKKAGAEARALLGCEVTYKKPGGTR